MMWLQIKSDVKFLFILFAIQNYLVFTVEANQTTKQPERLYNCTVLDFKGINMSDETVVYQYVQSLTLKIWSKPMIFPETPLLKEFRHTLVRFGSVDSNHNIRIFNKFTSYLLGSLKFMHSHYPSYCAYAEAINKSVKATNNGNITQMVEVGYIAKNIVENNLAGMEYSILKEICCKENIPEPYLGLRNCYDNGFSLEFNQAWELYGYFIPCPMFSIIKQLYNSYIFSERVVATIFTLVLIPVIVDNRDTWVNGNVIYQLQLYEMVDQAGSSFKGCHCRGEAEKMKQSIQTIIDVKVNNTPIDFC